MTLFSHGFYFVYVSPFFIASVVLPQQSCMNRALQCSGICGRAGSWEKLSFLRPVFHMPKAFCGIPGLSPADLRMQAKSAMLFADQNVCGGVGVLYIEKKTSFTQLLNGTEFLEAFSHDFQKPEGEGLLWVLTKMFTAFFSLLDSVQECKSKIYLKQVYLNRYVPKRPVMS